MKMQAPSPSSYTTLLHIPCSTAATATATPTPKALLLVPQKSPNLAATATDFSFSIFRNPNLFTAVSQFSSSPHVQVQCSSSNKVDSSILSQDDDDDDATESVAIGEEIDLDIDIEIEIEKTGNNCRRIRLEIGIEAPLNTVWNLLTDYERLADFIPGLAVCQVLDKTDGYARLLQIGEQKLALGLKFNAKGIVDCYETPLETLPNNFGHKRDIRFNMVEGDFEIFQGKWSLQQKHPHPQQQQQVQVHTSLSYMVDVKPKMWLPVRLVEGRLCKEIKLNLACIRQEALKLTHHNTTARQ
ncbi:hypothetical protein ACFX13_048231 [Malus domestica]|uniref:Coenzyme Q-binding protein COQ10 START domain-containing protein n=1 Tax=Malus domestica TaxID=3750 RepID=A0A498JAI4_MALDO|nr:uncharacterized protein LOC126582708 isoform X1 [Malus sylvestris]RXH90812.1 hypothetical protein DVH24_035576 [Malus domestica]